MMFRMRFRQRGVVLLMLLMAGVFLPVHAQDESSGDGHGVVRLASTGDDAALLQPILSLRLFDVDPATGVLLGADASDHALAASMPSLLPADEVVIPLSRDRVWSDGEPVTAYDVLYTLFTDWQLYEVIGARIIDDYTIALRFASTDEEIEQNVAPMLSPSPSCDDLPRSNVYVRPSHAGGFNFQEFLASTYAPEEESPSLDVWRRAYTDYVHVYERFVTDEPLTSGSYTSVGFNNSGAARYAPADGSGAALELISMLPLDSQRSADLNAFIAGDIYVLFNPPFSQRSMLRDLADPNVRNVQIAELPGQTAYLIVFNFANPRRPLPGFHPETGELLEQGQHPIFSDIRVRRALQLALDRDQVVERVFQQSAEPLTGLFPRSSWAYDPSLEASQTNIAAANRLLEEAGWHDSDGDGIRECVSCQTAPEGTELTFALDFPYESDQSENYYQVVNQIYAQWRRIGVVANTGVNDAVALYSQTFDAYLQPVGNASYENADPDRTLMFTPSGDILNMSFPELSLNFGSYSNPQVTELMEQARTVSECSLNARTALYHELDRVLQEDVAYLSVVTPNEFYAAAPNILGFAPRTGDPLWNVESWVVSP